jgi:hypothetical protein
MSSSAEERCEAAERRLDDEITRREDDLRRTRAVIDELSAARAEYARLASEFAAVDRHRQELIASINAIGASQSWRLGYALTWPIRVMRRGGS